MQPENSPRALPLVVVLYGQLRAATGIPDLLTGQPEDGCTHDGDAGTAQRARRRGKLAGPVLEHEQLAINLHTRTVTFDGKTIELRRREYDLLVHLAHEPERVFTRHELMRDVWGYKTDVETRTVDSHAYRLRRRLEQAGAHTWVRSIRGVGYRLAP